MTSALRLGRWQDVLADVECSAFISDPPYSERTHSKQRYGRQSPKYMVAGTGWATARGIGYAHLTSEDVHALVAHWSPRTRGWFAALTDAELVRHYEDALRAAGRYVFAPLACVQTGMNVRLTGDGPSNWTCWLVVARPTRLNKWGTLPGAYVGTPYDPGANQNDGSAGRVTGVVGSRPLWMMRAIVRDYSRPGDLVCDPFAGGATTLLAAMQEGRRAIGSEVDPETFAKAQARLATWQPSLFTPETAAVQAGLDL